MSSDLRALRLAAVVRRQHGAFSRGQAVACGYTDSAIRRRLRVGVWVRAHAGVYLDLAVPRNGDQDAMAACLACAPAALASHRTAAALLGLELGRPPRPEVTVPEGRLTRSSSVRVYRTRHLAAHEVASIRGVPVTAAPRTLADLARVLDPPVVELALDSLWRRGYVQPDRLAPYLATPHQLSRAGTGVLRALVRERMGQRPPGSDLETLYMQILKSFSLPLPVRQYPVSTRAGRRFLDLAYPDKRVAIELNGFDRHARDRRVFDDDHVRRNHLEALGWTIREFTWTQCTKDRLYVAFTSAEAIGLVPAGWRRR